MRTAALIVGVILEFIFVVLVGGLLLALCLNAHGATTTSSVKQPVDRTTSLHEFKYQVGLLWEQRLEFFGEDVTTVLKMSDPMRPLLKDVLDVRLCGDQTKRFKGLQHDWMLLVMSRTSPRRNSDCRDVVAIFQIRANEEELELP